MRTLALSNRWSGIRWRVLLPLAARSHSSGRVYAQLVSAVELLLDPHRSSVASTRAARWLGGSDCDGRKVFRQSLISEAREEAECALAMRYPDRLAECLPWARFDEPECPPAAIYGALHLGSPILAYVHLSRVRRIPVRIIGRPLDDANPMPPAKRRFGQRKVAWLEGLVGRAFLGVDAGALARARAEVVEGRSLYAALDVPGDVSGRNAAVGLFGERIRLAAGVVRLSALARVPIVPLVAVREGDRLVLEYGEPLEPCARGGFMLDAATRAIADFVRRFPGEWWLWPYVVPDRV